MAKILKYKIEPKPELQRISFPQGAQLLSVIEQRGEIIVYALVDTPAEPDFDYEIAEERKLYCVGTGWNFSMDELHVDQFIGTVKVGPLVWHVFEVEDLPF